MNHDTPSPDHDLGEDTSCDDDLVAEVIDLESQQRLWLRAIVPLLQLRSQESDPSGRVQLALDMMHVAACERVGRLLRSDLGENQG
jgi:hypothetical protein